MVIKKKKESKTKKQAVNEPKGLEDESLFPEVNLKSLLNKIKLNKNLISLLVIIGIIILLIIAGLVYKEKSSKFTYNYIPFEKNYYGSILLYTARFNFVNNQGQVLRSMEIDFRNDPRKIKDVNVEVDSLKLVTDAKTYVVDNDIRPGCEDAGLAFINLARFLSNVDLDVKGAVSNSTKALETNVTLASCSKYPGNTVILVGNGEENLIKQTSENCYEITFKECDVLRTTEKFEVFVLGKILEQVPIA